MSRIGIIAFIDNHSLLIVLLAGIVYLLFHFFVFSRLVKKNESRIIEKDSIRLPWYHFFDKKGYLIMLFFITFGIVVRKSGLVPKDFFAFFYTGLGLALVTSGVRFVYLSFKYKSFINK